MLIKRIYIEDKSQMLAGVRGFLSIVKEVLVGQWTPFYLPPSPRWDSKITIICLSEKKEIEKSKEDSNVSER